MVPVRTKIQLGEGVAADLLVTPHLAAYKEFAGVSTEIPKDATAVQVMERYADIMFLSALNAWELDGHGTAEDYPHTRGDFHALMQSDPKAFAKAVKFIVEALTGKSERQLVEEEKERQSAAKAAGEGRQDDEKKKKGLLYRITHRSRRSS